MQSSTIPDYLGVSPDTCVAVIPDASRQGADVDALLSRAGMSRIAPKDEARYCPVTNLATYRRRPEDAANAFKKRLAIAAMLGTDVLEETGAREGAVSILNTQRSACRVQVAAAGALLDDLKRMQEDGTVSDALRAAPIVASSSVAAMVQEFRLKNGFTGAVDLQKGGTERYSKMCYKANALIIDKVETGNSLKAAGFTPVTTIFETKLELFIGNEVACNPDTVAAVLDLRDQLNAVLLADEIRIVETNVRDERVALIAQVIPGFDMPTVIPQGNGWSVIKATIPAGREYDIETALKRLGASGTIISKPEKFGTDEDWESAVARLMTKTPSKEDLEKLIAAEGAPRTLLMRRQPLAA